MTCTPLYLAAQRAYVILNEMQRLLDPSESEARSIVRATLYDLHEALGLEEEPTVAWWKDEMRDRAERRE